MKCIDPVLCNTLGTRKVFRHFSLANPVFKLTANQVFNCGTCIICRKRRSLELAMRCVLEASLYDQNCFLTLTYDEKNPEYHNTFNYPDIQQFKKKLRSHCTYHFDKTVRIFNVHEYGKNGKKHWHLVVFNHDFSDKTLHTKSKGNNLYVSQTLAKIWGHGNCIIGDITEASAMYQSQYMQKDLKHGNNLNEKKSHSKHSGLGREYFLKHYKQLLSLGYVPFSGRKFPLPRYFQKLGHKHWSHFNETSNFFDNSYRKKLYTPFKENQANIEISQLYSTYCENKKELVDELEKTWETFIHEHISNPETKPDFVLSGENYIHDLKNRNLYDKF